MGFCETEDIRPPDALVGAKILIVDDNPSVLELIESEVSKTGAEAITASLPHKALEQLQTDQVDWDAAILDYDMPQMNGAQLAARIRDHRPLLPIILCTALHEIEMDLPPSLFDERVNKSAISGSLNQALVRLLASKKVERA